MIVAVVVTYFPDLLVFSEQLRLLVPQVDKVVVVDNGSGVEFQRWFEGSVLSGDLYLLPQEGNLGIAEAQNIGIRFAKSLGAEHVIFFDQDSRPQSNMVESLFFALKRLQADGVPVAAVAPCYRDAGDSELSGFVRVGAFRFLQVYGRPDELFVEADFLIASGTLVPVVVLDFVGYMDSSLFIDHVDTEWCLRAKSMGFRLFGVPSAIMLHSLGEDRRRVWFLKWRDVSFHKPFRYYYIFRNSVNMWGRSNMPVRWKIVDFIRILQSFVFFGVFSSQRTACVSAMCRGVLDAFRGVTGKMP